MKLYLSSYKLGNKTKILEEWLKNIDNKILLIPNARDAKTQDEIEKSKIIQNIKMLEDIGFKVKVLDLKLYFNNYEKLFDEIKNYNSCCVIGGNVFVLRQAMKISGFDKFLLTKNNDKKFLYIGYSAGSCILGNTLKGLELVDEPINPYNDDPVIYDGIGIIDYSIAPHYKSEHKETKLIDNLVEYFENNTMKYKALRDGEVIIEK